MNALPSGAAMTTAVEPDGAPRLASLDILRGIAILGILFMNINDMGASLNASFSDFRIIGWTAADQIAWWLREVAANGTARCMLEMLFGAGMVILTDRAAEKAQGLGEGPHWLRVALRTLFGPWAVMRGYYWRNLILFLFGLVHLFILMWPGDILHTYGIAAMIAFLFRRMSARALLCIGVAAAVFQLVGGGYSIYQRQQVRTEVATLTQKKADGVKLTKDEQQTLDKFQKRMKERDRTLAEDARRIALENRNRAAATGTALSWFSSAWSQTLWMWGVSDEVGEGEVLEPIFVLEAASTMLIGAALFRWGILQGRRSRRFYLPMLAIGYGVGLTLRALTAQVAVLFDHYPHIVYATTEVARLATTCGHIAAVHLLLGTNGGRALLKPFEAAGRTALTIYICQTIVCLWLLYPPFALGLYGQQGWMALMLTALAVDAALLLAANWYVRRYRIAPVEWAWRSIIARRALPFGRNGAIDGVGAPLPA